MSDAGADFGPITEWRAQTPWSRDELRRNVAHALSLGLPELSEMPKRWGPLSIVANGPSARSFDVEMAARWHHAGEAALVETLALNGAGQLFVAKGCAPTWWAACDPGEIVAGFLREAPPGTVYLVASQCHPSVFEALKDRDVLLWHLHDEDNYSDLIEGRLQLLRLSSIGLMAFEIARALGFDNVETWGWDGCLFGQRFHATDQPDGKDVVVMHIGETRFPTTRTFIYEMRGALGYFTRRRGELTAAVNGPGMFGAALRACGMISATQAAA